MGRVGLGKDAVGYFKIRHVACEGTLNDGSVCRLYKRGGGDAAVRGLEAVQTTKVGGNSNRTSPV